MEMGKKEKNRGSSIYIAAQSKWIKLVSEKQINLIDLGF